MVQRAFTVKGAYLQLPLQAADIQHLWQARDTLSELVGVKEDD